MPNHESFMKYAIELSQLGMKSNKGGPFGACIVKDGKVIGAGHNEVTSSCDPSAHAEIVAIRNACKAINSFSLEGAVIYTSCEPCPMCLAAIYWARLDAIYYANTRKDAAAIGFDDDFIYKEILLAHEERAISSKQLLQEEAHIIFEEWQNKSDKTRY